jgi:hypothetical protein
MHTPPPHPPTSTCTTKAVLASVAVRLASCSPAFTHTHSSQTHSTPRHTAPHPPRCLRELVELPLRHPQLFKTIGVKPPKGESLFSVSSDGALVFSSSSGAVCSGACGAPLCRGGCLRARPIGVKPPTGEASWMRRDVLSSCCYVAVGGCGVGGWVEACAPPQARWRRGCLWAIGSPPARLVHWVMGELSLAHQQSTHHPVSQACTWAATPPHAAASPERDEGARLAPLPQHAGGAAAAWGLVAPPTRARAWLTGSCAQYGRTI